MDWLDAVPPVAVLLVVAAFVVFESLGLPLPGETILVAGVLVVAPGGAVSPWLVAVAATVGAVLGESVGYLLGRRYGERLLALGTARAPRIFSKARVGSAVDRMRRYGVAAVFLSRFVAVLRVLAGPLAGALRLPFGRFLLACVLGSAAWSFAVTAAVVALGEAARALIHAANWFALLAVVVVLLLIAVAASVRRLRRPRATPDPISAEELDHLLASGPDASPNAEGGLRTTPVGRIVSRVPFTLSFVMVFLGIGVATGGLWLPLAEQPWYADAAYGLPAFESGAWWTIVTGTFLAGEPGHYGFDLVLAVVGLGWLERARGTRVTVLYFVGGQLVAVLGSAALVDLLRGLDWEWPQSLAGVIDVGPSGGLVAALVAAVFTAPAPWRLRAGVLIGVAISVALLFVGRLADLEHFLAGATVLAVLARRRPSRPSIRDWRLFASVGLLGLGAVQVVASTVATNGPFGPTTAGTAPWVDVAVDMAVIALIARGVYRGNRLGWILAIVWSSLNVAQGVLLVTVGDRFITTITGVELVLASSALWLVILTVLVAGRGAFTVPVRRRLRAVSVRGESERDRAIALLEENGGGTLSWMTTWPEMRYFFASDGLGVLGVQRHSGVVIGLGDPVADPACVGDLLQDFAQRALAVGLIPCLFSSSEASRAAMPSGWRSLKVADDTLIDLPGLELTGKRWQPARGSLNRAEREGISLRLARLDQQPWAVLAQVRAISEGWVGEKGLPEMRFTLGGVGEALDPRVRTALAMDADGSVHGVLSWLPVYGPGGRVRGWTLDLMRRRDGGFPPVIEFLITASALAFRDEGAEFVSLSGAPLAGGPGDEVNVIQAVLDRVGGLLEPVYGFRSLHSFKKKFNPRYEPMYLLYRDEGDLPRIALGLTHAFLPTSSTIELARAGFGLVQR